MVRSRAAPRESRVGREGDEGCEKQRADPHGKDASAAAALLSAHPPPFGWAVDSALAAACSQPRETFTTTSRSCFWSTTY
jgi:hypothetical protein